MTSSPEIATPRGTLRVQPNDAGVYYARFASEYDDLLAEACGIVERLRSVVHPAIPRMDPIATSGGVLDVVHASTGPSRLLVEPTVLSTVLRSVADVAEGLASVAALPGERIACGPFSPRLFVHDHACGRLLAPGLWGLAYAVDRTTTGARMTTRHFVQSRETVMGLRTEERTETYYVGYALFTLLTDREPFEASTELEYLQAIMAGESIALSARRPDVPPRLSDLVAGSLAPQAAARPSLAELAAALRSMA